MKIEIIATKLEDILILNELDYDIEVELCGGMEDDGLTPDMVVVEECVLASKHPIRVMIRNHNNGFYYSTQQLDEMLKQIKDIKTFCFPTGFVYGCLEENQDKMDEKAMLRLYEETKGYSNTFHKAIDRILKDQQLSKLHEVGMSRILTQGGLDIIENNKFMLMELIDYDFDTVAGGGITLDNYKEISNITKHIHIGRLARIKKSYDESIDVKTIKKLFCEK